MMRLARRMTVPCFVLVACSLLGGASVHAQGTKAAKDAERLAQRGREAEQAVEDVLAQADRMLATYNTIMDGTGSDPEASYKQLTREVRYTEKKIRSANQAVESMNRLADRFFAEWEAELESYTTKSLKRRGLDRFNASKRDHAIRAETLDRAGEAFAPLLRNLHDQILFLGRDLSPEVIADLRAEADTLNREADAVFDTVQDRLASVRGPRFAADEAVAD